MAVLESTVSGTNNGANYHVDDSVLKGMVFDHCIENEESDMPRIP